MGTKFIASKHFDDILDTATQNPHYNQTEMTIDHLLASAANEELSLTFLFLRIFPFAHLLSECTPRQVKKIAKTLLTILIKNTPDDVFVDAAGYNEYFLLLPGVPKQEAKEAGERIHQVFQSQLSNYLKDRELQPGIQGCVVSFPHEVDSRVDLFRKARMALFYAQQVGESCIVSIVDDHEDSISSPISKFQLDRLKNLAKSEGLDESQLLHEAVDDLILKYKNLRLSHPR
ncbi:diguanylate cyclase [bacterium]|nr:diguanylate cyclase [bacterium]